MSKLSVLDMAGKKVSDIELKDSIFSIEPNMSAMHLVVVSYLANQRQGTQSTKTRSEVSGGGKKPWRQKGTGRARQGSTDHLNGITVVSLLVQSLAHTALTLTRRLEDLQ